MKELKEGIEELKDEIERVNKMVDEMESKEKRWRWKIFWPFCDEVIQINQNC